MSVDIVIFTDCAHWIFTRYAGAYKIASVLRENGYTVQVIEHFLLSGLDTTLKLLDKFVGPNTLMVGFSTTFMNLSNEYVASSLDDPNMFRFKHLPSINLGTSTVQGFTDGLPLSEYEMDIIRNRIKNINPNTKLVMGGTKANYYIQKQIDTFIVGFADNTIIEYAKFLQGKNPFLQYTSLGNGRIALDKDITATGYNFVNSGIKFQKSDYIRPNEVLPIEISRGCMFKCKFCYYPLIGRKKNDYTRTVDTLYNEFMYNYENFGTTKYMFADDTYNESVQKLEYMKEVYDRLPFKIEYCTYLRLDLIHRFPEMADLLKDSGLRVAMFGIETLNYEAAKCIGKGLSPDKAKETLQWLREDKGWKNNILMSSGFIIGLPKETKATVSEWVEELISGEYPLDSFNFHALRLFPDDTRSWKSEFERNYADYGYYFDSNKSTGWINEHWQMEDTVDMALDIHSYSYEAGKSKMNGFLCMMLQNYGFTWNDIHTKSCIEFNRKQLFLETRKMADEYFKKLLSYEI